MDKVQHWGVHVHINGENVLSIESNSLSGIENIGDYEDTVRGCAYHLLSFIGGDSNFRAVSDELTRLRAEVETLRAENERLHAHCDILEDRVRHHVHEWYHGKLASLQDWARKQPEEIKRAVFGCLANGSPSVLESPEFSQKMTGLKLALELSERENERLRGDK